MGMMHLNVDIRGLYHAQLVLSDEAILLGLQMGCSTKREETTMDLQLAMKER